MIAGKGLISIKYGARFADFISFIGSSVAQW